MPQKKYSHNQYPTTTKSNQCPTKLSLLPNLSHIHTTTKFCHSHAKRKFLHVQEKIPTTSSTNKFSHTQQNFPQYPQNLPIPINISMHIPTKFYHIHKNKVYTCPQVFPHSYKSNTKFTQFQYSQNPNQSSFNNITNYLHCQYSKSHQHCPNCTVRTYVVHVLRAFVMILCNWLIL